MRWDAFHLELAYSNVLTGDGHHVLDRVLWRNVLYIGSDPPLSPARARSEPDRRLSPPVTADQFSTCLR